MKLFVISLVVSLCFTACGGGRGGNSEVLSQGQGLNQTQTVDIFVVGGQSNACGYSEGFSESVSVPEGKVFKYFAGTIVTGNDPFCAEGKGSAWPAFGTRYIELTGRIVLLVPTAVPASTQVGKISGQEGHWDSGGNLFPASVRLYQEAVVAARNLGMEPRLKGILWHQGESDALAVNAGSLKVEEYESALRSMIDRFRAEVGSNTPFYLFSIGQLSNQSDFGPAQVREVQKRVATSLNNLLVFEPGDASGCSLWDGIHYTQRCYNLMGAKSAEVVVVAQRAPQGN